MANLILTQEEKDAASWLDLDDDALGKLCRTVALQIQQEPGDTEEVKRIWAGTAVLLLCNLVADLGAETATFEMTNVTLGELKRGNWQVTVKQLEA